MWIDRIVMENYKSPMTFSLWVPRSVGVVLGCSNSWNEVYKTRCELDHIPVGRRWGGGGAVVLHPGCLVLSCGVWVSNIYQNLSYFHQLNDSLIRVLPIKGAQTAGISDIALNQRKIVGTSLFRSRHYLLYQASLLVHSQVDLMEKYLPHPSCEPDYRNQKSHRNFVSSLADCGYLEDIGTLWQDMSTLWPRSVREILGEDEPRIHEFEALESRLQKDRCGVDFALEPGLITTSTTA